MKGVVLTILVACLTGSFGLPSVLRFEVERQNQPKQKARLQNYVFKNCLPADKEIGVFNSLEFKPDPLVFPGPLNVSFDIDFKADIDSPLKGSLYLGKKVGSVWVKVPCIGKIGSCTYDDICSLLSGIGDCPAPFVAAGIPCVCPFKKGSYKLPVASFTVETDLFPPGDYHLQANLTMNADVIGCYDILATFGG